MAFRSPPQNSAWVLAQRRPHPGIIINNDVVLAAECGVRAKDEGEKEEKKEAKKN